MFHGTIVLNGTVEGEIQCRGGLTVGPRGLARANISADSVVIEGEVAGNVTAQERVELAATARMVGDIQAPVIMISEGGQFHGNCRVTPTKPSTGRALAERAEARPASADQAGNQLREEITLQQPPEHERRG